MTGFKSKRKASLDTLDTLDTLDHMPYQGRPTRPEELAQANPWRDALDNELVCLHLGTADSFPDARAALNALIDWHTTVAFDPEVSSYAQALIDKGAAKARAAQAATRAIADEQSFDSGLWFVATTATEAHLQAALRRLTAAVEGEPVALTDEQIWILATQCTLGSDLHIDKFARAIEAAHGIGATP